MPRHCRWCGRFVSADQPLTYRQIFGWSRTGQKAWRAWSQLLCPECRVSWSNKSLSKPVQPRMPVYHLE